MAVAHPSRPYSRAPLKRDDDATIDFIVKHPSRPYSRAPLKLYLSNKNTNRFSSSFPALQPGTIEARTLPIVGVDVSRSSFPALQPGTIEAGRSCCLGGSLRPSFPALQPGTIEAPDRRWQDGRVGRHPSRPYSRAPLKPHGADGDGARPDHPSRPYSRAPLKHYFGRAVITTWYSSFPALQPGTIEATGHIHPIEHVTGHPSRPYSRAPLKRVRRPRPFDRVRHILPGLTAGHH